MHFYCSGDVIEYIASVICYTENVIVKMVLNPSQYLGNLILNMWTDSSPYFCSGWSEKEVWNKKQSTTLIDHKEYNETKAQTGVWLFLLHKAKVLSLIIPCTEGGSRSAMIRVERYFMGIQEGFFQMVIIWSQLKGI